MGVRFDTVISCYILLLPTVICTALLWFCRLTPLMLRICYALVTVLFSISFLLCTVDVPFFSRFFTRLNSSMFTWLDHFGIVAGMIVREPKFMLFIPVLGVLLWGFIRAMRRIRRSHSRCLPDVTDRVTPYARCSVIVLGVLLWGVIFLGIRGRISKKSPIKVGTAYFSNNPFINQLGLNPVFSLMRSCMDNYKEANKKLNWIPDDDAISHMSAVLRHDPALDSISPIARIQESPASGVAGYNLVLILMERMSAEKMSRFGNPDQLTPFLDSLSHRSYFFENFYGAGIHTYNGIYSSLFGHPALMGQHPMYRYFADKMAGLPNILYQNGYQTAFFIPYDDQFDNAGGFLSTNDVLNIYSQANYPGNEVHSSMGVSDEFMFRFSIPVINKMWENGKPFFVTLMTSSDHEPYILPDDTGFTPRNREINKQMTEFADWSLSRFMQYASAQPWYRQTVFAFVADHGCLIGQSLYDISLSYHHIPFIIHTPGMEPRVFDKLGTQVDIPATLASLLGISFVNNTFGIDLLNQDRQAVVFSTDNTLACMNDSLLYIYNRELPDKLHFYRKKDINDYSRTYPEITGQLKKTAFSWLQTSQWMIENRKTRNK
jgi:phosphoglycerol transferase MdoB-like AlkP superfamily enzyme